MNLNWKIF